MPTITELIFRTMKVYTKTGDKGTTSLVGGKRVPKNHPRVEAYGDIDELISYLGVIISDISYAHEMETLKRIQENLMVVSAQFASDGSFKKLTNLAEGEIEFLESEIDRMTGEMPPQTAFILPGAPRESSECHVARTVCRRAERHAIAIFETIENQESVEGIESGVESQFVIGMKYLNRLSDYLFVLGRYFCHKSGVDETFWLP